MFGARIKNSLFPAFSKAEKYIKDESPFFSHDVPEIEALYPYFRIDLASALENGNPEDVIAEALRVKAQLRKPLGHILDGDYQIRPSEFKGVCGSYIQGDEYNIGYKRAWGQWEYLQDPNYVIEFTWHVHDGYGRIGGTVEVWIDLVRREII